MTAHAGVVAVLVVDDEEPIRNALRKFLKQQQFEVYAAGSADEALQQLRLHKITLMLSDIRMPGTSGVDLVPQAIEIEPDLAILMLTAVNDATSAALCMQRGAMDYLTKPIELADLGRAVQRAIRRREMLLENRHLNQWLKEEVTTRTAELHRQQHRMERISTATLEALVNALEAKDPYLRGHSARVADLSANIATELGLNEEEVDRVRMAGRLHDLGKIGTRDAVVNKEGPLTEEFEHVKQHHRRRSRAPHLGDVVSMVKSHHEARGGTGYPDDLRREEIPLGGRITRRSLRCPDDRTALSGEDDARTGRGAYGGSFRNGARHERLRGARADRRAPPNARLPRRRRGSNPLERPNPGALQLPGVGGRAKWPSHFGRDLSATRISTSKFHTIRCTDALNGCIYQIFTLPTRDTVIVSA